jgi:hypothetical protein
MVDTGTLRVNNFIGVRSIFTILLLLLITGCASHFPKLRFEHSDNQPTELECPAVQPILPGYSLVRGKIARQPVRYRIVLRPLAKATDFEAGVYLPHTQARYLVLIRLGKQLRIVNEIEGTTRIISENEFMKVAKELIGLPLSAEQLLGIMSCAPERLVPCERAVKLGDATLVTASAGEMMSSAEKSTARLHLRHDLLLECARSSGMERRGTLRVAGARGEVEVVWIGK